jgi:two-component system, LytTR family, response regulator
MQRRPLTAIIVDDEKNAIAFLKKHLANIDFIKILGSFTNPKEAVDEIRSLKPDILFLDIQMPLKSGFEVTDEIRRMNNPPFIIFITSYEKFAIRAIKHAAFDYLLKPVNPEELLATLLRVLQTTDIETNEIEVKFDRLLQKLSTSKKLKFNTSTGFIIINSEDIVYLQASRNYCDIFFIDDRCETVTMNMNLVSETLPQAKFFRISRSNVINLDYLRKVERRNHTCQLRVEGETIELPVSPRNARLLEHEFGKN